MNVQLKASSALPPIKSPDAHWIGVWVGPIAVLDVLEKKNSLEATGNDSRTVQPVSPDNTPTTLFQLLCFLRWLVVNICERSRSKALQHRTHIPFASLMFIYCWCKHSVADPSTLPTQNLTWYFFLSINILYAKKKFQIKCLATSCTVQWTFVWWGVFFIFYFFLRMCSPSWT